MYNNSKTNIEFFLDEFNIWDSNFLFNYIINNYKQLLLLLLVVIIIALVDYINNYNNMIFGVMQVIPGVNNNKIVPLKPIKNKKSKK